MASYRKATSLAILSPNTSFIKRFLCLYSPESFDAGFYDSMSEYNNNQDEYQLPHLNGTPVQMLSSAFGISETSALAVTNQQNYEVKFNIAAPPSEVNGEVLEEFTEADLDKLSELLPPLDESTWLQLNAESHQGFNCQVIFKKLEFFPLISIL